MSKPDYTALICSHAQLYEALAVTTQQLKLYLGSGDTATLQLLKTNDRIIAETRRRFGSRSPVVGAKPREH